MRRWVSRVSKVKVSRVSIEVVTVISAWVNPHFNPAILPIVMPASRMLPITGKK